MAKHPLLRLLDAIEPWDLRVLTPPVFGWRFARAMTVADRDNSKRIRLDDREPEFLAAVFDAARWIAETWFRWRVEGVENVPAEGGTLMVGNHSGGLMVFDGLLSMLAVWDHYGPERVVHGMGHDALFWDPTMCKYAYKGGFIPAGHDGGEAAIRRGRIALVYPGSDYDSFRPFAERNKVVLAERTGFVKLALRTGAPIAPVVTAGAQEQYIVLTRGEPLANLVGLKQIMRSNVFPIALMVPWGIGVAYVPYLPLPAQITMRFLPPLSWPELGPEAAHDETVVKRCYDEVVATMQAAMDDLTRDRVPWLG